MYYRTIEKIAVHAESMYSYHPLARRIGWSEEELVVWQTGLFCDVGE